jgi:hypothetical protein
MEVMMDRNRGFEREDSDHRSFSSDSSFEDYSNQDSNSYAEQQNAAGSQLRESGLENSYDEQELNARAKSFKKKSRTEMLQEGKQPIQLYHLPGTQAENNQMNDILQLDEIEEIKEESGESIYSEMDNFSRKKRRGTLLGIDPR